MSHVAMKVKPASSSAVKKAAGVGAPKGASQGDRKGGGSNGMASAVNGSGLGPGMDRRGAPPELPVPIASFNI